MASAGRSSELHVLVFDLQYIQFKAKGAGVTLYFSHEFMQENQRPNQVNDPWNIPEKGKCTRGHVTDQVRNRGSFELGAGATITSDLAKLNLICHMNYSFIFTEISFYPETSIFIENIEH